MESGWKGRSGDFCIHSLQSETGSSIRMIKEWFPRIWNTHTLRNLHLSRRAIRFHDEWRTGLEKRRAKLRSKDTLRTIRHGTPANKFVRHSSRTFFSRPPMVNASMKRFILRELAVFRNYWWQFFFLKRKIANIRSSSLVWSFTFKVKLLKIFRDLWKSHFPSVNWSNILLDIKEKLEKIEDQSWIFYQNFLSKTENISRIQEQK